MHVPDAALVESLHQIAVVELRVAPRAGHLAHIRDHGYLVRPEQGQTFLKRPVRVPDRQHQGSDGRRRTRTTTARGAAV
jgi:hypothetical protein